MTISRCIAVVAALLVLGIGTACQGEGADPDPSRPPQSEKPGKSVPTPSDKLPEMPAVAGQETRKGAVAFGGHYYDLINYGRATGDWKPAKDVTASTCKPCEDFWSNDPSRMNNGLSIRFGYEPVVTRFDESERIVVFPVSSDRNVKDVMRRPLNAWADHLHLSYQNGTWKVTDLRIRDMSKPLQSER